LLPTNSGWVEMSTQLNRHGENHSIATHGQRPDYGSGSHEIDFTLNVMAAAVDLARRDLLDPLYSAECQAFLTGDLVALFAECLGYEGSFIGGRT